MKMDGIDALAELDSLKEKPQRRNTCIITLCEGDILKDEEGLRQVISGEISIFADGTIDDTNGELANTDRDGVQFAVISGHIVFDINDIS